jgi:hypothetical protein
MFSSPRKSGVAAPHKGPINLITNNFRIRSQNKGIIYTYKVDFIEGSAAVSGDAQQPNPHGGAGNQSDDGSNNSRGSLGTLETFQKYKIINAHSIQLKQIFMQFVFVGSNLYSTTRLE